MERVGTDADVEGVVRRRPRIGGADAARRAGREEVEPEPEAAGRAEALEPDLGHVRLGATERPRGGDPVASVRVSGRDDDLLQNPSVHIQRLDGKRLVEVDVEHDAAGAVGGRREGDDEWRWLGRARENAVVGEEEGARALACIWGIVGFERRRGGAYFCEPGCRAVGERERQAQRALVLCVDDEALDRDRAGNGLEVEGRAHLRGRHAARRARREEVEPEPEAARRPDAHESNRGDVGRGAGEAPGRGDSIAGIRVTGRDDDLLEQGAVGIAGLDGERLTSVDVEHDAAGTVGEHRKRDDER